jgi:hypothetical protein
MADARRALDDFLFAMVGEQGNGTALTVVSALGRLGFDPWVEARRLAELPRPAAAHRLGWLIGRVPGGTWSADDARTIAERLVGLLPDPQMFDEGPAALAAELVRPQASAAAWLVCLVLLSALLLAMTTRRDLSLDRMFFTAPLAGAAAGPSAR